MKPAFLLVAFTLLVASAARSSAEDRPSFAYLGITAKPAGATGAADLPDGVGLLVTFVDTAGPAGGGTLRAGDLLQKLDDQLLINPPQLVALIHLHHPNESVTLSVVRDHHVMPIAVKLGEKQAAAPQANNEDPIPTLPGVKGLDDGTGQLPFDVQLPLPGNARVAFDDGVYSARVDTDAGGHQTMTVRNTDGKTVATGPVDTAEQWNAFPADVRQHLTAMQKLIVAKRPRPTTRGGK